MHDPLEPLERLDPKMRATLEENRELAFSEGELPKKYKFLIAMAIDAAHGAVGGVRSLTDSARAEGATDEEIAEALRVAIFVGGAGCAYCASNAFADR